MNGTEKTPKKPEAGKAEGPGKPKKVAKVKAVKEVKPKKEKTPKEPQVVFAFRLTEAERDQIHKAAGPGKASQFVLGAALAAASGDRPTFEELITQAKTHRR